VFGYNDQLAVWRRHGIIGHYICFDDGRVLRGDYRLWQNAGNADFLNGLLREESAA
jgi:hypothetical protein